MGMAKKAKMPTDVNQRAKAIVDFATGTEDVPDPDEARSAFAARLNFTVSLIHRISAGQRPAQAL